MDTTDYLPSREGFIPPIPVSGPSWPGDFAPLTPCLAAPSPLRPKPGHRRTKYFSTPGKNDLPHFSVKIYLYLSLSDYLFIENMALNITIGIYPGVN